MVVGRPRPRPMNVAAGITTTPPLAVVDVDVLAVLVTVAVGLAVGLVAGLASPPRPRP